MDIKPAKTTVQGVGTGPADLATAGPKFPANQESPQLVLYRH